jgi:tetratricopeptide (TPR) repeat protein
MMCRLSLVLSLLAGLSLLPAANSGWADQKDPRLNDLFAQLRSATGTLQGRAIEQQIWTIWMTSDNDEVNKLMEAGVDAMQTQDYKTAIADFTRMIQIAPEFAEGWNKRATVLYLVHDFEGSRADVDKTLTLEPRHFGALSGLGLIDVELDRDEEAIVAWEKALDLNPNMPAIRAKLDEARERLRDKQI